MRTVRVVSAVLALVMVCLLPLALSPADAVRQSVTAAASPKPVPADLHIGANVRKSHGHLEIVGYVTPPDGPVIISRATHCNTKTAVCNFHKYATTHFVNVDAESGGRYEFKVEAPDRGSWYWQARVGPHKSRIWQTCKTTTASC